MLKNEKDLELLVLKIQSENPDFTEAELVAEILDEISPGITESLRSEDTYIAGQSVASILYILRDTPFKGRVKDIDVFNYTYDDVLEHYPDYIEFGSYRIADGMMALVTSACEKDGVNFITYNLEPEKEYRNIDYSSKTGCGHSVEEFFDLNAVMVSLQKDENNMYFISESSGFKEFMEHGVIKPSEGLGIKNLSGVSRAASKQEQIKGSSIDFKFLLRPLKLSSSPLELGGVYDFDYDSMIQFDIEHDQIFTKKDQFLLRCLGGDKESIKELFDFYKIIVNDALGINSLHLKDKYRDFSEKLNFYKDFFTDEDAGNTLFYWPEDALQSVVSKCIFDSIYRSNEEYKDIIFEFFNDDFAYSRNVVYFRYHETLARSLNGKTKEFIFDLFKQIHKNPSDERGVPAAGDVSNVNLEGMDKLLARLGESSFKERMDFEDMEERAIQELDEGYFYEMGRL